MPEAPFDPGRLSVGSNNVVGRRNVGPRFRKAQGFRCPAAQPVPKSLLRDARLRLPLKGVREACAACSSTGSMMLHKHPPFSPQSDYSASGTLSDPAATTHSFSNLSLRKL